MNMRSPLKRARGASKALLIGVVAVCAFWQSTQVPGVASVPAPAETPTAGFFEKVMGAAAQGATAATVAAILSACSEPLVNRLLVKRMTFAQAWAEMTMKATATFFLTTFPTNMLKFPIFEVINILLSFTSMGGAARGIVNGFLFCTVMLPVTNYRFRKSMGWEIKLGLLYQAYIPTVARDIVYGWARGIVEPMLRNSMAPETFFMKAFVFGITIWAACIISSPCNEWRGYTLQPPNKKLAFGDYFKPVNYARSTGIGATIMGIALMVGMLIAPLAEELSTYLKQNPMYGVVALVALGAGIAVLSRK